MRLVLSIRASRLSWIFPTNEKLFQGQGQSQGQNQVHSWNKGQNQFGSQFPCYYQNQIQCFYNICLKIKCKGQG